MAAALKNLGAKDHHALLAENLLLRARLDEVESEAKSMLREVKKKAAQELEPLVLALKEKRMEAEIVLQRMHELEVEKSQTAFHRLGGQ